MSRSRNLYDLQRIDSQLDRHRNRLREIAAILADNSLVKRAEAAARKAETILEKTQKELRGAETRVRDQRLKIKQDEAKLYSGNIRNPKELQDLQQEVQALKRYLGVLEDRQLEAMLEVDEVAEQHQAAQEVLAETRQAAERSGQELLAEKSKIEAEMSELGQKRQSVLQTIPAEDLTIYEALREKRGGVAVARVNDQACAACGTVLTAALNQAARSPSQIHYCDTCGRILFGS